MSSDNDSNPSVPDGSTDREELLKVRLTAFLLGEEGFLLGEEGELGENGREELERELEQSESLRQELELLRRTVDAVKRAVPRLEALEPRRRGELIETASASAGRGGRARTVWYSLSGLAAAAVLVLLLWPLFVSDSGEPQAALESGPGEGGELLAMEMKMNRLTATSPGGKRQEWKTEVLLGDGDVRTTKRYAEILEVQAARPRGLEKLRQLTSDELESGESVPPAAKAAPESQNLLSKTFEWGTPGNDLRGSYGRRRSGSAGLGGAAEGERQARNDTSRPDGSRLGRLTTAPADLPALPAGAEPIRDTGLDGKYKAGVMTGEPGRGGEAGAPAAVAGSIRIPVEPRILVDEVLSQLDRRAEETPDMMFFRFWGDNPFVDTRTDGGLSTFAVDVDTASYTLMRNYLMSRRLLPPPEAVRTEEFVNYFPGGLEPPTGSAAFAVHTEVAPSPFAHESSYLLLKIGIKAREVAKEERKPCALVFVVDTSGSMRREDRLELVKDGLRLLVPELDEGDSVGIVAFDREARTVLEPTPASERERILDAVGTLHANQNTNVDAGLRLGYEMAARSYLQGANNRVILLSDGVANTGVTEAAQILERVRSQREKGIYLTCVGVGMGNHNDALLEQLADRGDGQCVYVDRREEARKVFVDNLTGTLEVIARDVKIQVTFDPKKVVRHRLLGYENRAMAHHLFRDNTVDAGEVGAGHEVVALYELKPAGDARGKLATVRLRYQTVEHNEAVEMEHDVDAGGARSRFEDTSPHFQLSALVAEFAEVLRDSYWARGSDLSRVASLTQALLGEGEGKLGTSKELVELVALMKKADALVRLRDSRTDERREVVDALKDVRYRSAVLDELGGRRDADRQHLDSLRRQNDDLRRRLEDVFRR